jgi:hypothetical protein
MEDGVTPPAVASPVDCVVGGVFLKQLKAQEQVGRPVRREAEPHGKKEMLLRGGGSCGSFHGVDHDSLFAALRGSGVNGIQIDAFPGELLETLRQRTRLVG